MIPVPPLPAFDDALALFLWICTLLFAVLMSSFIGALIIAILDVIFGVEE